MEENNTFISNGEKNKLIWGLNEVPLWGWHILGVTLDKDNLKGNI